MFILQELMISFFSLHFAIVLDFIVSAWIMAFREYQISQISFLFKINIDF